MLKLRNPLTLNSTFFYSFKLWWHRACTLTHMSLFKWSMCLRCIEFRHCHLCPQTGKRGGKQGTFVFFISILAPSSKTRKVFCSTPVDVKLFLSFFLAWNRFFASPFFLLLLLLLYCQHGLSIVSATPSNSTNTQECKAWWVHLLRKRKNCMKSAEIVGQRVLFSIIPYHAFRGLIRTINIMLQLLLTRLKSIISSSADLTPVLLL